MKNVKKIIERLKNRIESGLELGLIRVGTACDLHSIVKELEKELRKRNKIFVFEDSDMRYIANRIDPSFYDIQIEGADKAKEEVIRKLKIILNDCLNRDKE